MHRLGLAAQAGKIDPNMERVAGVSIEKQRKMANKMINRTTADSAALQILKAVENNERRVLVGADAKLLDKLVRLVGSAYQVLIMRQLGRMRPRPLDLSPMVLIFGLTILERILVQVAYQGM